LTVDIIVLELILIHNNRYTARFYCFIHISRTFTEAELVKTALQ